MATVLRTPFFQVPLSLSHRSPSKPLSLPLRHGNCVGMFGNLSSKPAPSCALRLSNGSFIRFERLVPFASSGETEVGETEVAPGPEVENSHGAIETEDSAEDGSGDELSSDGHADAGETSPSVILASLKEYKEALLDNDETKQADIVSFLISIEDERLGLDRKVASLSEELSVERERLLRISADFDNFRKRTERERLSLVTNAQGEVVERLLPVLDNFERAKTQIKVETEGEGKINNSYQNIYKQFLEILGALGVVPVETVGNLFDPLLHEAIMQEESTEYVEGVILEEYRKGFKLGDRLLRPSMVKVSAGPGPANPEGVAATGPESVENAEDVQGTVPS